MFDEDTRSAPPRSSSRDVHRGTVLLKVHTPKRRGKLLDLALQSSSLVRLRGFMEQVLHVTKLLAQSAFTQAQGRRNDRTLASCFRVVDAISWKRGSGRCDLQQCRVDRPENAFDLEV